MDFNFVPVDRFTPSVPAWSTVGNIASVTPDASGRSFLLAFGARSLQLTVLGPRAFRLRFNPAPGAVYTSEYSVAVVSRDLGLAGLHLNTTTPPGQFSIDTGVIRIQLSLNPFSLQVFRGTQLIHADFPNEGVLYIPNQEVIAVTKSAPSGAFYFGCGEKPGAATAKNGFSLNFFNFDNYTYTGESVGQTSGPLNPTEPLYCSIPFLVETNPAPTGPFAGAPYACGVFLDNTAQTFINVEAQLGTGAANKYYLGSLYNELDYYFFAGDSAPDVLAQYTTLTGRAPMPPRYVFGLHQGAYGYFDRYKLAQAASSYRAARIPCDGLHIDVDFQDNYRTFTHSEIKFPNAPQLFQALHTVGFKMSTNITPIITTKGVDENGDPPPKGVYQQQVNLQAANAFIGNNYFGQPPALPAEPFEGGVNYGYNYGNNPYVNAYPPVPINRNGGIPLTAPGNYPDFGLTAARTAWGQQYSHLLNDLSLDMIWQDMTCPAINAAVVGDLKTFPQSLLMARESTDSAGRVTVDYLPNAKLHNSYVLNLLRATWEGINLIRPATRNFIIARGGYAGMQRYAALWTGDSGSTWDFLRINIPEVLNLGLSGVPISGCDIGGFAKVVVDGIDTFSAPYVAGEPFTAASIAGGITNYELLTRWMQLGSFLPWYRNHYDGYNKQYQEPYGYGEPVPTNCRKYVELRYRMMQVYYDAMYQWTQTGMPLVRALFLNDPSDPQVYNNLNTQFFVGRDFLVAPITDPHDCLTPPTPPTRSVYLPAGSAWYQFMDNTAPLLGAIPGGQSVSVTAGLDTVPIYVRAGAILPFCELEQWVGELPANPLTLNFYPGPDRSTDPQAYLLYQDDGVTTQAAGGAFRLSRVYQQTLQNGNTVTRQVRVARVQDHFAPPPFFYIAILGSITAPQSVLRDGVPLTNVGDPTSLGSAAADAYYWNSSIQVAFAKIMDNRGDTTVAFNY